MKKISTKRFLTFILMASLLLTSFANIAIADTLDTANSTIADTLDTANNAIDNDLNSADRNIDELKSLEEAYISPKISIENVPLDKKAESLLTPSASYISPEFVKRAEPIPEMKWENLEQAMTLMFPDEAEREERLKAERELWDKEEKISQIPDDTLKEMTTDELIETVLDYPRFPHYLAFDNPTEALDRYININVFSELLSREDAGEKLIEMYSNIDVNKAVHDFDERFQMLNIELLLGRDEVLSKLSDDKVTELLDVALSKYTEKCGSPEGFSGTKASFFESLNLESKAVKDKVSITKYEDGLEISIVQSDMDDRQTISSDIPVSTNAFAEPIPVSYTYIYTPKQGWSVKVITMLDNMDASEKQSHLDYVKSCWPTAQHIGEATTKYNCHSYAWYSNTTSNPYWMNDPTAYVNDGSYFEIPSLESQRAGDRVFYLKIVSGYHETVHSAIIATANPINWYSCILVSKWGTLPLVRHPMFYDPYTFNPYDNYHRSRDKYGNLVFDFADIFRSAGY